MATDPAATAATLAVFLACVTLATIAQTLTGFAFGLILLGLVAVLGVAGVADAANAAMVLTLVNALTFFHGQPARPPWRLMRPALATAVVGVGIGLALLTWLSGHAVQWLQLLLGIVIVASAVVLLVRRGTRAQPSSAAGHATAGLVSGLLGGLFASSGPPMVYHLHRQPLAPELVRRALLLTFAVTSGTRTAFVVATGQFSRTALLLAATAVPVVWVVTRLTQRHPPPLSPAVLRVVVSTLLVLAGSTLVARSGAALLRGG